MHSNLIRYSSAIVTLILLMMSPFSFAANSAVQAVVSVSKNQVVKNEVFQMRIVVDQRVSQDEIDFSALEGDFYMGRPSFGTSFNSINGVRSTRSEWNISLAAQKLGTLTIPSFEIAGVKTQPIQITVRMDENQPKPSDFIELESKLSTNSLYPKESATLDFRLIIKADPRRLQNAQIVQPTIDGMNIQLEGEPYQYQTIKDGVEVTIVDQTYRIEAVESGEYTLIAPAFTGTVIHGSNRTGTTTMITADTAAEQFTLTVLPKPASYTGSWLPSKKLTLEQQWLDQDGQSISSSSPHQMRVGDALTRIVKLQIEGLNPNQFPDLTIASPSEFRVYEEKPQFTQNDRGDTVMTTKQVLIPQKSGEQTLSDVNVNWWNSAEKQQKTSTINGLALSIEEAVGVNNSQIVTPNKPLPQSVSVVHDRGIWPYLTALFAMLWFVSVLYILRNRNRVSQQIETPIEYNESSSFEAFKHAVSTNDMIKSQFHLSNWLNEHSSLSTQDANEIDQFKQWIAASCRNNDSAPLSSSDKKGLFTLMKKVEKQKQSAPETLSRL
ncbi:BatD family protein [Vibrio amylolyticus]|uniref:BatD family protein n=1 Tax=Vibrio amylolyticus TaxID=2847292 RepID=UPI00354D88D6